jgi:hypothetical protein
MAFAVGKRVAAESESTDRRPRSGVVEEVLRGDPSPRHRSAGTTAMTASTRPQAVRCGPNNVPRGNGKRHHENGNQPET